MSANFAVSLATRFFKLNDEVTEFFAPHLEEWLALEVIKERLTYKDANRDFYLSGITSDQTCLEFESTDWEESWQYGGYEKHYGKTLTIPLDFFSDPAPWRKAAEKIAKELLDRKAFVQAQTQKSQIALLEAQLAKAKAGQPL